MHMQSSYSISLPEFMLRSPPSIFTQIFSSNTSPPGPQAPVDSPLIASQSIWERDLMALFRSDHRTAVGLTTSFVTEVVGLEIYENVFRI